MLAGPAMVEAVDEKNDEGIIAAVSRVTGGIDCIRWRLVTDGVDTAASSGGVW